MYKLLFMERRECFGDSSQDRHEVLHGGRPGARQALRQRLSVEILVSHVVRTVGEVARLDPPRKSRVGEASDKPIRSEEASHRSAVPRGLAP
jgi:hypothetical protein